VRRGSWPRTSASCCAGNSSTPTSTAICRPNSTVVTYGYSFGDEHINRTIRDMLTVPSTHLVIISRSDTSGRIMNNYEAIGRPSQMSLLIGEELGDLTKLTENFLPKSAIDRTTSRMAELLKDRIVTQTDDRKIRSSDEETIPF
jgi:hypothetical protein